MNSDDTNGDDTKREGNIDEAKGRVHEAWGDLTGNEESQAEGEANQAKGKAKQVVGDLQNAVDDAMG